MRLWTRTIVGAAAATLMACGGGEAEPTTTGAPMGGAAEPAQADIANNNPPRIERLSMRPPSPRPGERIVANVQASDPDGDPVRFTYQWTLNGQKVGSDASLHTEGYPKDAVIDLRVTPHDGKTEGRSVTATARMENQMPVMLGVVIEPLGEVSALNDVVASPRATDPDGDELEFEYTWWINGEPADVEEAVLPKEFLSRGDKIELAVRALDGSTESETLRSQPFEVVNSAPEITSTPGGFEADGSFRYQLGVSDPDGDRRLRYRMLEGPKGMQLDVLSGKLTWTPNDTQAGNHAVSVEVDDMFGGKTTQKFSVGVAFEAPPEAAQPPANQSE